MNLIRDGDIFQSTRDWIVIPTNCKGIMGKGLAKSAKAYRPDLSAQYTADCLSWNIHPGHIYPASERIIWAATKDDWRDEGQWSWTYTILQELAIHVAKNDCSMAIPAVGCGEAKQPWTWVHEELDRYFWDNDDIDIYPPRNYVRNWLDYDDTDLASIL